MPELLEEGDGTVLRHYAPGISGDAVSRGVLKRFLPGSLVGWVAAAGLLGLPEPWQVLANLPVVLLYVAMPTVGFGLGLRLLGSRLYPDAEVEGRRSVIAGALSPLGVFIALAFGGGLGAVGFSAILVLIGVIMALGMYFAWLDPTPEGMRGPGFARNAQLVERE